jgi:hypothetical protein
MLRIAVSLVLFSISTFVTADEINREKYQQVVEKHYPGFRILNITDFADSLRKKVHDGYSGALIVGNFDFDKYSDFAAIIVSSEARHNEHDFDYNYYVGKEVVCSGNEHDFDCRALSNAVLDVRLPYSDGYLAKVPAGIHDCQESNEEETKSWTKKVKTEIDSIESVFGPASGFTVLFRDGTSYRCTTSD